MIANENENTPPSSEPQSSAPAGSDTSPTSSIPETPATSEIIVAPDFDWVEMGEDPAGSIQIDFEINTGLE